MRHIINAETVIRGFQELIRRAINAETVIPEKNTNRPEKNSSHFAGSHIPEKNKNRPGKKVHTSRVPRFRKKSKIGPKKNSLHFLILAKNYYFSKVWANCSHTLWEYFAPYQTLPKAV